MDRGECSCAGAAGAWSLHPPPDPVSAREILRELFALQESALRQPVPLSTGAGLAYAQARISGGTQEAALKSARTTWEKGFDRQRPEFTVPFSGPTTPFDALLEQSPLSGEEHPEESTRFGCLARRVWDPLLALNPSAGLTGEDV